MQAAALPAAASSAARPVHPQAGDGRAAGGKRPGCKKTAALLHRKRPTSAKEQVDALQAELTATASEQITAANDRVREAEQKRLEAAAAQLETARSNGQQQIDACRRP